jgi:hypothetical protein
MAAVYPEFAMSVEQPKDGRPHPQGSRVSGPEGIGRRRRGIIKCEDEQIAPPHHRLSAIRTVLSQLETREIWIVMVIGVGAGLLGALSF